MQITKVFGRASERARQDEMWLWYARAQHMPLHASDVSDCVFAFVCVCIYVRCVFAGEVWCYAGRFTGINNIPIVGFAVVVVERHTQTGKHGGDHTPIRGQVHIGCLGCESAVQFCVRYLGLAAAFERS